MSDKMDVVVQLRMMAKVFQMDPRNAHSLAEAADEIDRLREVLKPFAEYGRVLHGQRTRDDTAILELFDIKITGQDLKNAADALNQEPRS